MENENGKLELISVEYNGKNKEEIVKIKKGNKVFEGNDKNIINAIMKAIRSATGIEGCIEEYESYSSLEEDSTIRLKIDFNGIKVNGIMVYDKFAWPISQLGVSMYNSYKNKSP